MNWKKELHEDYRRKFGCKNIGEVCWCEICVYIEMIIADVIANIKNNIDKE